jgi:tetratricopeptide (TPR) repeat protein
LQTRRRVLGEDNDNTIAAKRNKALCLQKLKRFDEALVLFDEVIEDTNRNGIILDPVYAERLHDKSLCLQEMGHSLETLPLCEQALGIFMKFMGAESPFVATNLLTKARILDSLQSNNEALDSFNQSLTIRTKIHHGTEHSNVAEVLHYKGLCLKHFNDNETESKELGKQAIGIYERKLGVNHPTTVEVRNVWVE